MVHKRGAFLLALWASAALYGGACGGEDEDDGAEPTFFEQTVDTILDNLVADYWSADGNWEGDMQGDATMFAPRILYPVAEERHDATLTEKATTTVDYEVALIKEGQLSGEVVGGALALVDGYAFTGDSTYRNWFVLLASAGYTQISSDPDPLLPFLGDLATIYGTGAYLCLLAHELTGDQLHLDNALALIDVADTDLWNAQEGMYDWESVMDWPQALMAAALAKAYHVTGDAAYRTRAETVVATMDTHSWDAQKGGYFGHAVVPGVAADEIKGLSGNNFMAWALLDLYEATGEPTFLTRAKETLEWILSEDLYSPTEHLIYHHWTAPSAPGPGRADYFCTGCNFQALCNLHRYNRLTASPE